LWLSFSLISFVSALVAMWPIKIIFAIFLSILLAYQVSCEIKCGTTDFAVGNIFRGDKILKGQFPFLAAIFSEESGTVFCGGTLIAPKHVLTGL